MSRITNFYAGPATLPESVLIRAQKEFVDYDHLGLSLIETSHRSAEYDAVHNRAIELMKEHLGVGDGHEVLLLQGGATMQFGMVPLNLLTEPESRAAYVVSGSWGKKARADAARVGGVDVVWDGADSGYTSLPDAVTVTAPSGSRYLHITTNETIEGVQWKEFPDVDVPIIADMSSDILSRPIPTERFGLIYAGAQKNLGPAGLTVVVVRRDVLDGCADSLPAYLSYRTHAEKNSLYNTPPVFAVYMLHLVLEWLASEGGLTAVAARNERKAAALYAEVDDSDGFYRCPVDPAYRSTMNVVFRLPDEAREKRFVAAAAERGMIGLKGHRSVGGIRASIYNAMTENGVERLATFMREFRAHG